MKIILRSIVISIAFLILVIRAYERDENYAPPFSILNYVSKISNNYIRKFWKTENVI